ncbi:MAG: hypothetical protein ACI8X5_003012 [Planctomycetota bacterium]
MTSPTTTPNLSQAQIARVWWPLAASWLLMGVELPVLTAVVQRMADGDISLAAYGSIVFPLSLIIEAPIIMLLAAATALVRDKFSYRRLQGFMMGSGLVLTLIHMAVAFTPLFDLICVDWLEVPSELVNPARLGMRIMTPWSWAIAYRRMQHGVMIRAGKSKLVGAGTLIRLLANIGAMFVALQFTDMPGIAVGALGIACGVSAEALLSGVLVRPIVEELPTLDEQADPLTWSRLTRFYAPLALTPFMTLVLPLVGSAAMSRMPNPLVSLAAWPAVHGLVFLFRGVGMAYNEVVVALAEKPGGIPALRHFAYMIAIVMSSLLALLVATPLADLWFGHVMHLSQELAQMTRVGVSLCLLMPAYQVLQSWFQGVIVTSGKTRAIPEAVAAYSLVAALLFAYGVYFGTLTGLYFAVFAFTSGGITQTAWLWWRSRKHIAFLESQGSPV